MARRSSPIIPPQPDDEDLSQYDDQDIDQNYPYGIEDMSTYDDQDIDQGYHPNFDEPDEFPESEGSDEDQAVYDSIVQSMEPDDQRKLYDALVRALSTEETGEDEIPVDPVTGEPVYDDTAGVPPEAEDLPQ